MTFEVGDLVSLHEDEDFVREQFRIFGDGDDFIWLESLNRPKLGKTYPVEDGKVVKFDKIDKVIKEDSNWVGLLNYGSTWYFPKTTLRKVPHSKSFLIQFICI